MKKIFDNKIIRTICAILEWTLCGILILLILLTGFQKFSNQGSFFGYRIYTIASGSMIPTYNIGDTLLIEEMPASEIKVGDAVTYISEENGKDGLIITHQVMEVVISEDGQYSFHTKGIANNIEDPIVYEKQVLGKVVHKFFFLSLLGRITTNMVLTLIFVILPIAFIIAMELVKVINDKDDDDVEDEIEKLKEYVENKDKNGENLLLEETEKEEKKEEVVEIVEPDLEKDEETLLKEETERNEKFLEMFSENKETDENDTIPKDE